MGKKREFASYNRYIFCAICVYMSVDLLVFEVFDHSLIEKTINLNIFIYTFRIKANNLNDLQCWFVVKVLDLVIDDIHGCLKSPDFQD